MLYLKPPAVVLDTLNVCVYPDDQDKLTWYYLPMYPRVSRTPDNVPLLTLTKYTSEKDSFALLNFVVDLGLSADELATCRKQLVQRLADAGQAPDGVPLLLPATARSGSVELMLLGRKSAGDKLVKGISQAAAPALYNDNRAVFSVLLDPQGSDIVEASLRKGSAMSAVAVMYTLAIDGLRPAYKVDARASWKTIHDLLREEIKQDGIFTGADIVRVIDKMKDSQAITINVDNLQSPDEQTAGLQAMMGQVRSMIFDQFFKPAPQPEQSGPSSFLTGLADLSKTGMAAAATGGLSLIGKFSWSKEDRTEILDKTLEIDLSERSIVTMKVYPQAFLADLVPDPKNPPILEIDGGDADFFTRRQLTVDLNQALADDGVASVAVNLDYGGKKKSLLFRKGAEGTPQTVTWTSSRDGQGKLLRDVAVSYSVNFAPVADGSVPAVLQSASQAVQGDFFTVSPRSLYNMAKVVFYTAPDFNWTQYPIITLACHYEDRRNNIVIDWKSALYRQSGQNVATTQWTYLRTDLTQTQYSYRVGYQPAGGKTVELDWVASELPMVTVSPSHLDLTLYPPKPGAWPAGVDNIQVDLAYDDPANGLQLRLPVRFAAGETAPRKVGLLVADASCNTIGYTVTWVGERSANGPPSRTRQPTISLAAPLQGHTFAALRPAPGLFDDGKVTKVVARLRHVEGKQQTASTEMVFRPADKNRAIVFDYDFMVDPTCLCKLVFSFADGPPLTTRETDIASQDDFLITLPDA